MLKLKNNISLSIAGFNIRLIFIPGSGKNSKTENNYLLKAIINHLDGFILTSNPVFVHHIIKFYMKYPKIFQKTGKKRTNNFLYFFSEEKNTTETFQHISFPQFLFILTFVLQKMISKGKGFLLHASAVKYHGKAVIFTGKPTAGKSTAMSLLNEKYPALADDSIYIKYENGKYYVYQTPLIEKNSWIRKGKDRYEIDRICFLKKAKYCRFTKITDKKYVSFMLSKQLWTENTDLKKQWKIFLKFIQTADNFYTLEFPKNQEDLLRLFQHLN